MHAGYAMIVGAGSGTGTDVAKRLAAEGWPVVLTRRNAEALEALAAEIEAGGGRALAVAADAGDAADVSALFETAAAHFGTPELACRAPDRRRHYRCATGARGDAGDGRSARRAGADQAGAHRRDAALAASPAQGCLDLRAESAPSHRALVAPSPTWSTEPHEPTGS